MAPPLSIHYWEMLETPDNSQNLRLSALLSEPPYPTRHTAGSAVGEKYPVSQDVQSVLELQTHLNYAGWELKASRTLTSLESTRPPRQTKLRDLRIP